MWFFRRDETGRRLTVTGAWPVFAAMVAVIAGVPGAAIAYTVPPHGPVRIPDRWWTGAPAPVRARVAIACVAGACAFLVAMATADTPAGPALAVMAAVYVVLAAVDLRRQRLPHRLTGAAWIAAAVGVAAEAAAVGEAGPGIQATVGALATVAVLLGVALAFPGRLGLGDVNLAGSIAFSLGWAGWLTAVTAVWIGLVLQLLFTVAAMAACVPRDRALPLGPALVAGWLVGILATGSI